MTAVSVIFAQVKKRFYAQTNSKRENMRREMVVIHF